MVNSRESIMIRLLDHCVKTLAARGLQSLFVDAVRGGDAALHALGEAAYVLTRILGNIADTTVRIPAVGEVQRDLEEAIGVRHPRRGHHDMVHHQSQTHALQAPVGRPATCAAATHAVLKLAHLGQLPRLLPSRNGRHGALGPPVKARARSAG